MKKIISYIIIVIAACTVITGCLPEKDDTRLEYKGPSVVEFKNPTLGQATALLTKNGISTAAADAQTDTLHTVMINTRVTDSILVQLVGPQVSTPTVVSYTIRTVGTTAVEGTNFNFVPTGARTVTIPANSSSAYIFVAPVANSIATVGTSVMLILDLQGAPGVSPSFNYKAFYDKLKR